MESELLLNTIKQANKLYPSGIPLRVLEENKIELPKEYVCIVDYTWSKSPWENESGQLLKSIIEKGIKTTTDNVDVYSVSDVNEFEAMKLIVTFGEQAKEKALKKDNVISTYSLKDLLGSVDKKKEFWGELKNVC